MKKFLAVAFLIAAPAIAMAQNANDRRVSLTPQQRAEKHTAKIDAIVSLTPDQRERVAAEDLRSAEAMQPHMNALSENRKAMREIGKQRRTAYASILTPEQQQRLKAAHKAQNSARKEAGEGRSRASSRDGMRKPNSDK